MMMMMLMRARNICNHKQGDHGMLARLSPE
jgi:hypothetical protein